MERKQVTSVAILDLSTVFDTVDHKLLLEVLQKRFRICDMALHWYENYARPYWMKMCINGNTQVAKSIEYSVLQGSCSRANIFTPYCSPVIDVIPNDIAMNGFADDHSICIEFNPSLIDHEVQMIVKLEGTLTNINSLMNAMCLR